MATLYIVGAPVDSLDDISLAALRILGEVDFILDEGWPAVKKLLAYYKIKTPLIGYSQSSGGRQIENIVSLLAAGKNIALVSEAGLPGSSDPSGKLALAVREKFGGQIEQVSVELIPSQSAVTAALAISGLTADKFIFFGWPPQGPGRQDFIRRVLESNYPAVVYESRLGLEPFLREVNKAAGENRVANKKGELELRPINLILVVVYRELIKMRETVYRGEIDWIIEKIKANANSQAGEFIVIIGK